MVKSTIVYDISYETPFEHQVNQMLLDHLSHVNHLSWYSVHKDKVKPCLGCFNCFIRTPGECIIRKPFENINKDIASSDTLIYVTPLIYGCYSPAIKSVLDHSIANLHPFFKVYKGQIHHKMRYSKLPNLIILAYRSMISPKEKEIFMALTKANATNYNINTPKVYFLEKIQDLMPILSKLKNQLLQNSSESTPNIN